MADQPDVYGNTTFRALLNLPWVDVGDRIEVEVDLWAIQGRDDYLVDGQIDLVYSDDAIIHGATLMLRGLAD